MESASLRFLARRALRAAVLVLAVSLASMLLVHLAPGDVFSEITSDPRVAAAERARLGLDRPFVEQYAVWLARAVRLDLGESARFRRPVTALLAERAGNTLLLGSCAIAIALVVGLPAGVFTGSVHRGPAPAAVRTAALVLVATPPLVTALVLLLIASRTGWFPTGGMGSAGGADDVLRYIPLPALALGLPVAASLERLQAGAMRDALADPCIAAARARGLSRQRAIWAHAWPLSLKPVVGLLGIIVGSVLSGSFAVEFVMAWPGLGDLMHQALIARDTHLAAGCAVTGAAFLAAALLVADAVLIVLDPRTAEA